MDTEPVDHQPAAHDESGEAFGASPDSSGEKLFVIFFLALVPLIGIALVAMVIYSLLTQ